MQFYLMLTLLFYAGIVLLLNLFKTKVLNGIDSRHLAFGFRQKSNQLSAGYSTAMSGRFDEVIFRIIEKCILLGLIATTPIFSKFYVNDQSVSNVLIGVSGNLGAILVLLSLGQLLLGIGHMARETIWSTRIEIFRELIVTMILLFLSFTLLMIGHKSPELNNIILAQSEVVWGKYKIWSVLVFPFSFLSMILVFKRIVWLFSRSVMKLIFLAWYAVFISLIFLGGINAFSAFNFVLTLMPKMLPVVEIISIMFRSLVVGALLFFSSGFLAQFNASNSEKKIKKYLIPIYVVNLALLILKDYV